MAPNSSASAAKTILKLRIPKQTVQATQVAAAPKPSNITIHLSDGTGVKTGMKDTSDVNKNYKYAIENPNQVFVICINWSQPDKGRVHSRAMYTLNTKFAIAQFGAFVHTQAHNMTIRIVSVLRDGPEHKQALANCGGKAAGFLPDPV
jgi:hypothetical protein